MRHVTCAFALAFLLISAGCGSPLELGISKEMEQRLERIDFIEGYPTDRVYGTLGVVECVLGPFPSERVVNAALRHAAFTAYGECVDALAFRSVESVTLDTGLSIRARATAIHYGPLTSSAPGGRLLESP